MILQEHKKLARLFAKPNTFFKKINESFLKIFKNLKIRALI